MPALRTKPESPEREEYSRFLKILGQRIRMLRKQNGWSYRDMVVDHGFHLSAWQSYESGKYGLSMISLLRVAKVFGMPPSELIADIDLDNEPSGVLASQDLSDPPGKPGAKRGTSDSAAKGV